MSAWKALERKIVALAEECGLSANRLLRGSNFSESNFDVALEDFPHIKIDAKYRAGGWKHHTHVKEIQAKYCKYPEDVPVLVTKSGREHGEMATLPLKCLLELIRMSRREL